MVIGVCAMVCSNVSASGSAPCLRQWLADGWRCANAYFGCRRKWVHRLVVARRLRALDHHVTPLEAGIAAFIVMAHRTRIPALCPYRSVLGAGGMASDQNARYGAAIGRSGGSFAASLLSLL